MNCLRNIAGERESLRFGLLEDWVLIRGRAFRGDERFKGYSVFIRMEPRGGSKGLKGRKNYVLLGGVDLRLENFSVENKNASLIRIKGYAASDKEIHLQIKLIRQGEVIKTFEARNIFDIVYEDDSLTKGEKTYYRLEITLPGEC